MAVYFWIKIKNLITYRRLAEVISCQILQECAHSHPGAVQLLCPVSVYSMQCALSGLFAYVNPIDI